MLQFYNSVSSRYLIFSAIISVLICQAMARHRFNHNYLLRGQEMRLKTFKNAKEALPKLLRLVLQPRFTDHHKSENFNHGPETPPQNFNPKFSTSCGRINCENITNYPSQLIKDLFEEQTPEIPSLPTRTIEVEDEEYENSDEFKNEDEKEESEETDTARDFARSYDIFKSYDTYSWRLPNEDTNGNIQRNKLECLLFADKLREEQDKKYNEMKKNKRNICEHKVRVTNPQETLDDHFLPFTIVNGESSIIIKGYECDEGIDCKDDSMGDNFKYSCKTNWSYYDLCVLNADKTAIVNKRIAIADGCNCSIVKLE